MLNIVSSRPPTQIHCSGASLLGMLNIVSSRPLFDSILKHTVC